MKKEMDTLKKDIKDFKDLTKKFVAPRLMSIKIKQHPNPLFLITLEQL